MLQRVAVAQKQQQALSKGATTARAVGNQAGVAQRCVRVPHAQPGTNRVPFFALSSPSCVCLCLSCSSQNSISATCSLSRPSIPAIRIHCGCLHTSCAPPTSRKAPQASQRRRPPTGNHMQKSCSASKPAERTLPSNAPHKKTPGGAPARRSRRRCAPHTSSLTQSPPGRRCTCRPGPRTPCHPTRHLLRLLTHPSINKQPS